MKPCNVFFSIRCKTLKPHPIKLILAYCLGLIFTPLYGDCSSQGVMDSSRHSPMVTQTIEPDNKPTAVKLANQIRTQSHDDEDFYKAVKLYLTAAKKDNPEAQYWLAVMYLKGMG